jgi:hypothetical protein
VKAYCLAIQVTRSQTSELHIVGIHEEHSIQRDHSKFAGNGTHHLQQAESTWQEILLECLEQQIMNIKIITCTAV